MATHAGLSKGFPDIIICEPVGGYHGLFLELKTTKGKPRPEQIQWGNNLEDKGYFFQFAFGFESACCIIEEYLKL